MNVLDLCIKNPVAALLLISQKLQIFLAKWFPSSSQVTEASSNKCINFLFFKIIKKCVLLHPTFCICCNCNLSKNYLFIYLAYSHFYYYKLYSIRKKKKKWTICDSTDKFILYLQTTSHTLYTR